MAEFLPFTGLRYNTEKVELSDVIAPPYDVIKGTMRDDLIARSEYNVVRVELPHGEDDTKYEVSARLLNEWRAAQVLVQDSPVFYVYEQEFQVPGSGETRKRRGLLGALRLEEFGKGVQPHEHTLSGPKTDRLNLLRATRTNISPIFGLYDDSDGWINAMLDVICAHPPQAEAQDADGIVQRLWPLSDDETVNAVVAALEDESVLIADGHHRYETALNYRNERQAQAAAEGHEWTGAELENHVMMMCVSTSDPGLVVLPTHRVIRNAAAAQIENLVSALKEHFEVEPVAGESEAILSTLDDDSAGRLGLRVGGQSYTLRLKPGVAHRAAMSDERSDAYNALDVSILHTLILERLLGIGPDELAAGQHVSYTIDAADALRKADSSEHQAAFLMRPTPVEQVQSVAAAGDKMPQKSTYFYPKVMTGLALRPLDH